MKSLAPHCCVFFCSSVVSPKDMMTKNLVPRHCVFFCSSVGGPHGHNDKELSFLSLCSFVLML
jgi:hypothetical protein